MQARTAPEDWVASQGFPPTLWAMVIGDKVVILAVAAFVLTSPSWTAQLGVGVWAVLFGIVFAFAIVTSLVFVNVLRPAAVRATPEGVAVRRLFGPGETVPWSGALPGPVTGKFQLLRIAGRAGVGSGFLLTAEQWLVLRSSAYRPTDWARR